MNNILKKVVGIIMVGIMMLPTVLVPASAVDASLNLSGFLDALFGSGTAKYLNSVVTNIKQKVWDAEGDGPAADTNIWGILAYDGMNGAVPYDKLEVAENQERFPEHVYFKDNDGGYNNVYDIVLVDGTIYLRRHDTDDQWRVAPQPESLKGHIQCMSVDNKAFYFVDDKGWTYGNWMARDDTSKWTWNTAVCGTMETDPKWKMPNYGVGQWASSSMNNGYDTVYIDPDGREHQVGCTSCTDVYYVNPKDNSKICYSDPWLPGDNSREIASPYHGRFPIQSLSASSSTIFVTNKYGDMYTRLFDYDIAGGDEVFFDYSYESQAGKWDTKYAPLSDLLPGSNFPLCAKIRLPGEPWYHQPKIDGEITDRITIQSLGGSSNNRMLRVEGKQGDETGYFSKMLYGDTWTFHATGEPLKGNLLENSPEDTSDRDLYPDTGIVFGGKIGCGATLTVVDYNYADTENECYISVGQGEDTITVPAVLSAMYGNLGTKLSSVILPHSEGLTKDARLYRGAILLPEESKEQLEQTWEGRQFLMFYMKFKDVHEISMIVNENHMLIMDGSKLTADTHQRHYTLDRIAMT